MKIDGKALADNILNRLSADVTSLKNTGITPTMAVILVGDDPGSLVYIRQKQKAAERIGAHVIFDHQPNTITADTLKRLVDKYNADPSVHGLIIQRPVPSTLGDVTAIINSIRPQKDVDGFVPDSPFDVPVAAAVGELLKSYTRQTSGIKNDGQFDSWLKKQKVIVIGRGSTAGKPIAEYFNRLFATSADVATKSTDFATYPKERRDNEHCTTSVISSKTADPEQIMKSGDIIISCVGKERVVQGDAIKPGAILIGVGLWRGADGKLKGDYDESEIASIAAAYTPTPGGVGPVNVACLMQNLVKACNMNMD